ncbi:tetratricopeptide repeat protein [Emticicia sp. SJ17W-69]|uniref:tetratricopeptide repeat protein n=1 Tax=Emticicia sp. SJ17W-69 TaxID=3421657 RepID=UPI003EBDB834
MKFKNAWFLLLLLISYVSQAQFSWFGGDTKKKHHEVLLANRAIQIEATQAINNMYNFNYDAAERDFKWLTVKYPDHPIGFFLLGLNEWWKIVPDTKNESHDDACLDNMNRAIDLADDMLDDDDTDKEAAFFQAAAYAFKGRLYSERENWIKAAWAGKQAMKYLEKCRGFGDFSPELAIGDGLYNYYSKWIPENYPSLKPMLVFFHKGVKAEGIKQLEYVSSNAFYTRMEAKYFLMQIYAMENQHQKAYYMAAQMHAMYPNNAFFHRYAARTAFMLSKADEAETLAQELLANVEMGKYGYESTSGRYAAYILGYINFNYKHDLTKAKEYYQKTIDFALQNDSKDSGYFLGANLALGKIHASEKDYMKALQYYTIVTDNAEKKSDSYKEAKKLIEDIKKWLKSEKKKK